MVFRGKPSKACQRCRDRRLRCDLQRPSCGSCVRVGSRCHGYRDTDILRISDETQLMHLKASTKKPATVPNRTSGLSFKLSHLPLDLQVQARELFFAYYIADFCRAWDFLYPAFDPRTTPEHLSLSIDAASLAFLSHHINSPSAQNLGRRKYVSALKTTNKALQNPDAAQETSTLEASLLLDLFEKITDPRSTWGVAQRAHVDGALALVKLKGLQQVTDEAGLKVLARLALNAVDICISYGDVVSQDVLDIRQHTAKFVDVTDPKWRLSDITLSIINLVSDITNKRVTVEEKVRRCVELESKLNVIDREAPPRWSFVRVKVPSEQRDDPTLDSFYDVYATRMETQMWNVLRCMRIVLCDEIIESCANLHDQVSQDHSQRAYQTTALVVQELCASVPQMTDCNGASRHRVLPGSTMSSHSHTLSHFLDTYILLFGLYTAAWSRGCPRRVKSWIVGQLDRIAEHFGVKEAATVAAILKTQNEEARIEPWEVYRLIGSNAFVAG